MSTSPFASSAICDSNSEEKSGAKAYYCPHSCGQRVQYLVRVCVCVCLLIPKSKQAATLRLGNLKQKLALYKAGKFLQVSMAPVMLNLETRRTNCTDLTQKTFESK